jgi:hypothetical protein
LLATAVQSQSPTQQQINLLSGVMFKVLSDVVASLKRSNAVMATATVLTVEPVSSIIIIYRASLKVAQGG